MKHIKITLAILAALLFVSCLPAIASPVNNKNEPVNYGHRISETPNINVSDQFGNPVANVTIAVTHEQNGDLAALDVITPDNGMVPLEAMEGTYTYTVKSVPVGYSSTDQKIIQEYKPGASFNGKTIKISKNDNYNPSQFSSASNNYVGGMNISSNYNFTANFIYEFKTLLESVVREQMKIVINEEKAAEQNKPVPMPSPTAAPEPTPMPTAPIPEPMPTASPTPEPMPTPTAMPEAE